MSWPQLRHRDTAPVNSHLSTNNLTMHKALACALRATTAQLAVRGQIST